MYGEESTSWVCCKSFSRRGNLIDIWPERQNKKYYFGKMRGAWSTLTTAWGQRFRTLPPITMMTGKITVTYGLRAVLIA